MGSRVRNFNGRREGWIRLLVYLCLPLVMLGLNALALRLGGSLCILKALTGVDCPACGATRAAFALLQLDFAAAWDHNPLFTAGVYPAALFLILQDVLNTLLGRDRSVIAFLFTGRSRSC